MKKKTLMLSIFLNDEYSRVKELKAKLVQNVLLQINALSTYFNAARSEKVTDKNQTESIEMQ